MKHYNKKNNCMFKILRKDGFTCENLVQVKINFGYIKMMEKNFSSFRRKIIIHSDDF